MRPMAHPCFPPFEPHRPLSLFLDVDGTLLNFAAHPDAVLVDPSLVEILCDLHHLSRGALALVSGRPISALDHLFRPYRGAAVGIHGTEWRIDACSVISHLASPPAPQSLRTAIEDAARHHDIKLVEDKGSAIALHHRLAAPAMKALQNTLERICAHTAPTWSVLRGRQVLEVKPRDATKSRGVETLMAHPPFHATLPIAFGDDVTDLDMFRAIREHAGATIAVGPRIARHADAHLKNPEATRVFLSQLRDEWAAGGNPAQRFQNLQRITQK